MQTDIKKIYLHTALVLEQFMTEAAPLEKALQSKQNFTASDQAFIQAVCYGVLRYYRQLDFLLNHLLSKSLPQKETTLRWLLLMGLFQLWKMNVPAHTVVNELQNCCDKLEKSWAKGLMNAIFRRFLREKETLVAKAIQEKNHFDDFIDDVEYDWGADNALRILKANDEHPPMTLRVNTLKISRDDYLTLLSAQKFEAHPLPYVAEAIILETPQSVHNLPGFKEGYFYVQDLAPQLTATILPLEKNMRVLDACAAPGGKATHLLTRQPDIHLIALDHKKDRVQKMRENLQRLNLNATCMIADALTPEQWWDQQWFDVILCDPPCSSTGVIRRHPDIKWLARDIDFLAQQQLQFLKTLWPLLKTGGYLLYATCSVLKAENENVITAFCELFSDAKSIALDGKDLSNADNTVAWGMACEHGRQLFPGDSDGLFDGFYYALLQKNNDSRGAH